MSSIAAIEVVGPKVSGELAQEGIVAVVLAILCVLIYVWFRFEWQFAVGAVLSLLHDVLLTIGLFCLLRIEFNLQIIAAILTIVGYSLNDTVVVFDRIREFLRKYKSDAARRPYRFLDQFGAAAHPADLGHHHDRADWRSISSAARCSAASPSP